MEYLDGLVPPRPAEMQAWKPMQRKSTSPIIGPAPAIIATSWRA